MSKARYIFLFLSLFVFPASSSLEAQMGSFFPKSDSADAAKRKKIIGGVAANSTKTASEESPQNSPAPSPESSVKGVSKPSEQITTVGEPARSNTQSFDPEMDNKTNAPEEPLGIFGMPITDVEELLKNYGAKPFSYAFGKYSRMAFSVYLLTLHFDKKRNLGGIDIFPRPPFTRIEPQAREFLFKLLLQDSDKSLFIIENAENQIKIHFK
ncbi:MAG: hypothetical protein HQM10_19280 [Candidatus Riflebacteria bacterium]|nr:hypothetical protein [Candidatus Riflebacteria bacterium]